MAYCEVVDVKRVLPEVTSDDWDSALEDDVDVAADLIDLRIIGKGDSAPETDSTKKAFLKRINAYYAGSIFRDERMGDREGASKLRAIADTLWEAYVEAYYKTGVTAVA